MKNHDEIDSDPEDIEDVVGDSDQDSDAEEDLPLELDDGRSANKKDEMEVEHLATLERLRQTQRQDYLRVSQLRPRSSPPPVCQLLLLFSLV